MDKSQLLKTISTAKSKKDYDLMLNSALEAQVSYPNDKEIEELVHDARGYYVKEKLESDLLKKLEKNEDWQALQAVYLKLLTIFPESKKLQRLLSRVKTQIEKSASQEKGRFFSNAKEKILQMIENNELEAAESATYEILSHTPENRDFIHLLARIQHLIDKEIEKKLSLYFKTAIPELQNEYKHQSEKFIRI